MSTRHDLGATSAVAALVKEMRKVRGWSTQRLADECAAAGRPQLNRSVLANIETGRRRQGITVDELAALARAFRVSVHDLL